MSYPTTFQQGSEHRIPGLVREEHLVVYSRSSLDFVEYGRTSGVNQDQHKKTKRDVSKD